MISKACLWSLWPSSQLIMIYSTAPKSLPMSLPNTESSLTFSNMVWITNPDVGEQRRFYLEFRDMGLETRWRWRSWKVSVGRNCDNVTENRPAEVWRRYLPSGRARAERIPCSRRLYFHSLTTFLPSLFLWRDMAWAKLCSICNVGLSPGHGHKKKVK